MAAAICMPSVGDFAGGTLSLLPWLALVVVAFVALPLLINLTRMVRARRRSFVANWMERKRLSRHRERIIRQSILSSNTAAQYRSSRADR